MSPQPLAQIVRTFLALEALGQDEVWTVAQGNLIEKLATEVGKGTSENDTERREAADALRRLVTGRITQCLAYAWRRHHA